MLDIQTNKEYSRMNDTDDRYRLAIAYEHGQNGKIDYEKAKKFYTSSAKGGHLQAQIACGVRYLAVVGYFGVDPKKAVFWLTQAANQGNAYSQYRLGGIFSRGCGVIRVDLQVSLAWYQRAKAQEYGNSAQQVKLCKKRIEAWTAFHNLI